jgi:hypothetical protein
MWDPFVGKDVKNQIVPVGVAFQAFQTMDEDGEGFLMVGSFVTGLKRYPAIADSLGLLGRSMRTDALPLIYEYMYGTKNVVASRKVDLIEFVKIFSRADLGLDLTSRFLFILGIVLSPVLVVAVSIH